MTEQTKIPHRHAEFIKAWADGFNIEMYLPMSKKWIEVLNPKWKGKKYRIKPEPKPDVVQYMEIYVDETWRIDDEKHKYHNLKLTFDGETGKLKKAEVI